MNQATPSSQAANGREILLCVIGNTPQIVTETIYALAVEQKFACPTEVHLIASTEGAHRARHELLAPGGRGQLAALCEQYGLPLPKCNESTIHVIRRGDQFVSDLRSAEDNEAAADTTLDVVRELTSDSAARIHFSIAGGRKTMTFYLGYCASLLGRRQDEMSHVMVNPPFEQSPDFFFPPRVPVIIHDKTNRPHWTSEAKIDLALVPFLRLRGKLPPALLAEARSFGTVVRILNALDQPRLALRLNAPTRDRGALRHRISPAEGLDIKLPPKHFALLWMLASIKGLAGAPKVHSDNWRELYQKHFIPVYRAITGGGERAYAVEHATPNKEETQFRNEIDKLNKSLRERIGPGADDSFGVAVEGNKRRYSYELRLSARSITLLGKEFLDFGPGSAHASSAFTAVP